MAKFTAATQFAPTPETTPALLLYTDMRGHVWSIVQHGFDNDAEWWAHPMTETAKFYGLEEYELRDGQPVITFAVAFGPKASQSIITGIEERIEAARAAAQTPGEYFDPNPGAAKPFPWLLALLAVAALWKSGKHR